MLDAERADAPAAGPDAPAPAPEAPPAPAAHACATCGAEMAPEQDWCLNCGAAAPGLLGEKPGWRAFSTIAALTLVLVLGAAAASWAALSSHKRKPAVATAPAVAQVAPPAAATPPPTTPAPTTATPAPTTAKKGALPKVKAPAPTTPAATGTPVKPVPVTKAPAPVTSAPRTSPAPSTSAPKTTTAPKKPVAPAAPVAIKLDPSAGSTYDPFGKAAATGDAARALDGDPSTSWYVDPKAADGPIGAGYAINLGAQKGVKRIQLSTTTPGFRVEVYATDEATPPPDITDTRWSHITNVSNVGSSSGAQTIVVGGGTSKYQTVLLWITDRPAGGARVRISELKIFG